MLNWVDKIQGIIVKNELDLIKAIGMEDTPTWEQDIYVDNMKNMYYALVYGKLFVDQYEQLMLEKVPKKDWKKKLPLQNSEHHFDLRKKIKISLHFKNIINRDPYKEAHDGNRYKDVSPIRSPYATPLQFPYTVLEHRWYYITCC